MTESLDPTELPQNPSERQNKAEELKARAEECRARGESLSAMLFASDALMLFPTERRYLDLVDGIAQSVADPLALVPVASGAVHVATAAVRARILLTQKRWADAVRIITDVVEVAPELGYLDWLTRWLQPQVITALGWEKLGPTAILPLKIAMQLPTRPNPEDPRLVNLRAASVFLPALRQQFPDQLPIWLAETVVRRRLGDPEATLRVAREAAQRFPNDWRVVVSLANALGDAKRCDEALGEARRAMQIDPEDCSPLHDAAWSFLDSGRAQEAVQLFTELLERSPSYPARAAYHYAKVVAFNDPEARARLLELRDSDQDDGDGARLANRLDPPDPYYNFLPGSGDTATVAAREIICGLNEVMQHCGQGGTLNAELTTLYPDAPSVGIAFTLSLRAAGAAGGELTFHTKQVQAPDPRLDKSQVAYRIWNFDGQHLMPAVPKGHEHAQNAVAHLAGQVFRCDTWSNVAHQIAQQFGPDWMHGFLSVLLDPPLPPQNSRFDGMTWTYRCQVATAVILSYLGPWENSPGRLALYSMLYGPTDWITAAAIIALGWRARLEPRLRAEVEPIFGWMRGQIPKEGFTVWEAPLAHVWRGLSNHPPELMAELLAWIDAYEASVHTKNRTVKEEPTLAGVTISNYAEFCFLRDQIISRNFPLGPNDPRLAQPHPELSALCQRFGIPERNPATTHFFPYLTEWNEALNQDPELSRIFAEIQQRQRLEAEGVTAAEAAALNQIRDGEMDMHLRMAQAEQAQRQVAEGGAGDPDPVVFPGQPVAKLSDYVGILRGMQGGDMMGTLARYGLDMMSYGSVATAWGAKLAADPVLTEKFNRMMAGG